MPRRKTRPREMERFRRSELETQLDHLISRQTRLSVRENSALDRALKSGGMHKWVHRLFEDMAPHLPNVSFSAVHTYTEFLNMRDGPLLNYVWHGFACIWIGVKMECDTDISARETMKYVLGTKSRYACEYLLEAEREVASTLGFRFSKPKVSEFAFVLTCMVTTRPEKVIMDVFHVLRHHDVSQLPVELAAAAVYVVMPHTLHALNVILPTINIESIAHTFK